MSFEEWTKYVFDHPVTAPAWYAEWNSDVYDDEWERNASPSMIIEYLTRAFENSHVAFSSYTDAQVNQGLWFIISNSWSDQIFALRSPQVPLADRRRCIRSIYNIFAHLFFSRCSPNLLYLDEQGKGEPNPLDAVCYMWWDILPIHGNTIGPDHKIMAEEVFEVLGKTLQLESDACRESALHGLGHWHYYDPFRVKAIITEFLADHPTLRPELATYARRARSGAVI